MNNYICVGKIINTFGIKGELKIISDFEYKDRIFVQNMIIYVGNFKKQEVISNHRVHKNYDLITFKGYTNINEVLKYKGNQIFIEKKDLKLNSDEYLLSDLIGYKIIDNNVEIGIVIDYEKTVNNILLKIKGSKTFYLPLHSEFIKKIVKEEKKILTNNGSDLII